MMTKAMTFINEFLSFRRFAVVGASNDTSKYGNIVYRNLKGKGFEVYPVNPHAEQVDGDPCYGDVGSVADRIDGVVLVVPPKVTEQVVREAADAGIERVWMQPGAESEQAIKFCKERNIAAVHGACIMVLSGDDS